MCAFVWLFLLGHAQASGSEYRIASVGHDHPSAEIGRTTIAVQAGNDPLNRFRIVRLQAQGQALHGANPLMLLSPFGFPVEFWEITESGDYNDAFAPQVALAGHDVWLVDSRLADAEAGECESGAVDCSAMAGWDQETAIEDAMFAQLLVRAAHPFTKAVIGGFSGGSSTAMATVDHHPHVFAGLFMWEGTLYTADPAIRARNAAFCAQDEALLDAGVFFDPGVQVFKLLFQLATAAPNDPSPIAAFPPGTRNLQALLFAFTVPNPDNPLNFTESFIRLSGNPFTTSLTYSSIDRLLELSPLVGNYAPVAFIADTHCSIGGADTRFTDHLDRFHGDVLVYAEGLGFGQMMLDTAALMTHAHVTVDFHPELGESDPYFHVDRDHVALQPLLDWLDDVH
jgi:pimeloyl-ACP methyl ester carboxylesterase